jgi:hypothetical protein
MNWSWHTTAPRRLQDNTHHRPSLDHSVTDRGSGISLASPSVIVSRRIETIFDEQDGKELQSACRAAMLVS